MSEDEGISSGINTPDIRSVNEGKERNCSKQSGTNRKKPTTLDSQGQDADEDNDGLDLFYQQLKLLVNLKTD